MGVPSKCTIARTTGKAAYKLEAKPRKETTVFYVRKEHSVQGHVYRL